MGKVLDRIECTEQSMQPYLGPAPKKRGRPRKNPDMTAVALGPPDPSESTIMQCYHCGTSMPASAFRFMRLTRNTHTNVWSSHMCHHCARQLAEMVETFSEKQRRKIEQEKLSDEMTLRLLGRSPADTSITWSVANQSGKSSLVSAELAATPGAMTPKERESLNRSAAMKRAWKKRRAAAKLLAPKRPVGRPRKAV